MKLLTILTVAGAVAAQGVPKDKMNCDDSKKVNDDLIKGSGCKDIYFIMARASTEKGNMVSFRPSHFMSTNNVRVALWVQSFAKNSKQDIPVALVVKVLEAPILLH
jgi:hypothetical protein